MIKVVLIGAGNVACHLYKAFKKADAVEVVQWYNRSTHAIIQYQNETEICDKINNLKDADVYIIAISDDAITNVSRKLPFNDKLVVHTSGSLNIHGLDKKNRRGVFYPLQTFSKDVELDFSNVPFCIEVLEKKDLPILKQLAEQIYSPFYKINSEQRQILHLAAVYVNNFTNQLYRIAHEISDIKNINFDILKPLISETANKVQNVSPYLAQTGPALRNDKKTINKHLKLLDNETHKEIYKLLTKAIQETHGK
ncbi:MAG: DUF2520 domain-containing protein [Flavobacteriaceae bacterium]|nr:DUF2520 domain-containing protein [Bacteroidia bacterium]NNK81712.1 DUF2520 domain-containing protein [Flavobacteriaceae bacterium]